MRFAPRSWRVSRSVHVVELELVPTAEPDVVEAVRRAAAAAAVGGAQDTHGRWWRRGVEESLAARSPTPACRPE
jgi:hypothetical protein